MEHTSRRALHSYGGLYETRPLIFPRIGPIGPMVPDHPASSTGTSLRPHPPYHRVVNPALFRASLANQCRIYPKGRQVGLMADLLNLKRLAERQGIERSPHLCHEKQLSGRTVNQSVSG